MSSSLSSKKQKKKPARYGGIFDFAGKKARLQSLEDQIQGDEHFWNNPKLSAQVLQEKKSLEAILQRAQNLATRSKDLEAALELASEGDELHKEAETILEELTKELEELETQSLLGEEMDRTSALLTINAGAGGTESCDWAAMLMRMYLRFGERKGWNVDIHDIQDGDEAGVKSATLELGGEFAYGLLKSESGVHRLIRISPFDSNARRHTSFVSVFVSAVVDDRIDIQINPSDLKIDTYRASGAGGQHVNRTDSAVRMTHTPSGIVVQCQSQRSQLQNKEAALKMLKSKLYEREVESRMKKQKDLEDSKTEIAFGSQIRTFTLHPYKLVKDHRTDLESHSPDEVLDGELMPFIQSFLSSQRS